jgi:hypothetical protein
MPEVPQRDASLGKEKSSAPCGISPNILHRKKEHLAPSMQALPAKVVIYL